MTRISSLSRPHFNGKTTTYAYDSLNRLLSRTPDPTTGEPRVSFTYTATGKRASMTDASGTTNYTYDSMDRLITKITGEGTLNYTYDAAGHLASTTFLAHQRHLGRLPLCRPSRAGALGPIFSKSGSQRAMLRLSIRFLSRFRIPASESFVPTP